MDRIGDTVSFLRGVAETVRRIEEQAREALYQKDDAEGYRQKMREKTFLLMSLADEVEPFFEGMPEDAKRAVESAADSFSRRAGQAMELDSLFYMSALLYPEDYREGGPNDLEKFIERFRSRFEANAKPQSRQKQSKRAGE
ncbi:MAG: hypothetical protein LLG06_03300 [Desulfobacteraceae bacterium]|nr:hypothetical protein [Desulfobacteraceae bacterium]